ncbi:RNA polymerase sigma-70 factor (ECF subfamily) [Dysgonomonas alginatilytica]|uniref:RNA polymerase sigma-70 factor (ECF subfamily) n=1 Tax=Dysgonomonas alginatilytica TaxID=1605892 RepID=A0A2V3PMT4_9BACT|nr:sigma-70 family RNA polymerase sigma factor [Dysgonomonas alginatilytica]PXV62874.1 RNA polymerase sigma-70 factor (ECF subfamily) [Dysgonomonas alginatilytica]
MQNKDLEKDFMNMVQLHERIIYKVASFYADIDQSINDLYQEVILSLWKAYPSFRGDSKLSTWIYRIALNTCITFFRRNKRKPTYVDLVIDIPDTPDNNEEIVELYRLVNQLGKIERALVLLYLDEKSYKEIAEITGLTVTNVSTKISRIKEKLKKMSNE